MKTNELNGTIDYSKVSLKQEKPKSEKVKLTIERVLVYIFLIFLSILCLFPFYILIINSTRDTHSIQQEFTLIPGSHFIENWNGLMSNAHLPILKALWNSIWVSGFSAILTVYFSALTAYAVHTYSFKGKKFIETFILAIMMIPTQVAAMGLVMVAAKYNFFGHYGILYSMLILPCIASPAVYFYMKQYLDSVLPYEIIEAARVDGSSEIRIFHQMILPILKPALAVQFIFSYVSSWNNFFMPSMLLRDKESYTVPIIFTQLNNDTQYLREYGQIYLLMALAVVPVVIVYLIFSRSIIKNLTAGAVKG